MDEITQRRFGIRIKLIFGSERLTCTLRDITGEVSFSTPYHAIALRHATTITVRNASYGFRWNLIPLITLLLGLGVMALAPVIGGGMMIASMLAILGFLIAGLTGAFAVRFTIIPLSPAVPEALGYSLRVIKGPTHDAIMRELTARGAQPDATVPAV